MKDQDVEVHHGGNVFADLGVRNPDEMLLEAGIVVEIRRLMGSRNLTQTAAADLIELGQADLSKLLGGGLRGFSVERLMKMLTAFDQDVRIVSRPRTRAGEATISYLAASSESRDA